MTPNQIAKWPLYRENRFFLKTSHFLIIWLFFNKYPVCSPVAESSHYYFVIFSYMAIG